jgi:hypothetical protein
MRFLVVLAAGLTMLLAADVVDRVAVVVGANVITESELLREVRLTELLNGEPPDLSPEKRRAAAERLVDQQLIRTEMEFSRFPQPGPAEAAKVIPEFVKEQHITESQLRESLTKYGITEDELKNHLAWQAAAMQFTENRFRAIPLPANSNPPTDHVQTANRLRTEAEPPPAGDAVDQQMEAWLKEARSSTRIQFKKEAFQ